LWLNYRTDEQLTEFVDYNDLGLPIAYAIDNDIVRSTEMAQRFVEETFDLLLATLKVEDTGFETLDGLFVVAIAP
jgi:hypothetical protein